MDYQLPDGRRVDFDLSKVSHREYVDFARGALPDDQDARLLARVSGLTAEEIDGLPQPEWRRFVRAFYRKASEPLADPN